MSAGLETSRKQLIIFKIIPFQSKLVFFAGQENSLWGPFWGNRAILPRFEAIGSLNSLSACMVALNTVEQHARHRASCKQSKPTADPYLCQRPVDPYGHKSYPYATLKGDPLLGPYGPQIHDFCHQTLEPIMLPLPRGA